MNIVVLGNGLLGSEIIKQTGWGALSREKDYVDFCDPKTYVDKISEYDAVLNCIGHTNTYSNEVEIHRMINFEGVTMLSDICDEQGKKLIHISTDYVYANSIPNASETDIPLISENWYTYYKLMSDEYIKLKNKNYLICRTSFKPKPFPYDSAWVDVIGNFDYVDVISSLIIGLIYKEKTGMYNIGTHLKTMYELAKETNNNVKRGLRPDHVPHNISMSLNKLQNV